MWSTARKTAAQLLEAVTGIFLGVVAAATLQIALDHPSAARELPRLADHPCPVGGQHAPYLNGDIVTIAGTNYVCNGFDGSWRHVPAGAERRTRGS